MCLVYHTLFADETTPTPKSDAHLYGHVIDSKTGEHLPYATVTIPGTTIGTMTDASGHYFLKNLPTGTITVEARMMSYDPVRHEVTLKKGQSLELNFEIYEGENETYIEASVENSSSILYDKEIRNKPRTRRTKRNV